MMNRQSGRLGISLMPPSDLRSFSISRVKVSCSFLLRRTIEPSSTCFSISIRRLNDALTVLKLVSVPPSQRWLTYGMPQRRASSSSVARAERLVPTNRMRQPLAASLPAKEQVVFNIGSGAEEETSELQSLI